MNKKEKTIVLILGILFVAIIATYFLSPSSGESAPSEAESAICGDGACTFYENCKSCPGDCACATDAYCSESALCLKKRCGDGICTEDEQQTGCCEDCGSCGAAELCNRLTHTCMSKVTIPDAELEQIALDYLAEKNMSGTVVRIQDDYGSSQASKVISVDYTNNSYQFPTVVDLVILENGKIVDESWTT